LRAQYLAMPNITETLAVASPRALKDILNGYAPSAHATRVLAHLRRGTRYDEMTGKCTFDSFIRESDMAERQAARLVDLAHRSYRKMHAACKDPLFPTAKSSREPTVELARHFGLLPERNHDAGPFAQKPDRFEKQLAHDLLNPFFYSSKTAFVLKQGFVRARSGQELRVDEAVAMFENYLGIAARKERSARAVKNLNAGRAERRAVRRLQSQNMLMQSLSKLQMATLDNFVLMLKKFFVEDGFDPAEVEKASPDIVRLAVAIPLGDPDFQMLFRRHTARKGRPDIKRFISDLLARKTDHVDRVRARKRTHMQRSRLKQSPKPKDSSV